MKSKKRIVTRKEKKQKEEEKQKIETEKREKDRENTREWIKSTVYNYGGIGLFNFAAEEQDALWTTSFLRPAYDVHRMDTHDFICLIQLVFLSGPISINDILAYRVRTFLLDIRDRESMSEEEYKDAVDFAPPMLRCFVNKYVKFGLKSAIYVIRYLAGRTEGHLLDDKNFGCFRWVSAIQSCYVIRHILYIVYGEEHVDEWKFLDPTKNRLESKYHTKWGHFPYEVLKTNFHPLFKYWHHEWSVKTYEKYDKRQMIYHMIQRSIYIAWKRQKRRAEQLRKLWIAHIQSADRLSRFVEKIAKTHNRATNIKIYRDKKFPNPLGN